MRNFTAHLLRPNTVSKTDVLTTVHPFECKYLSKELACAHFPKCNPHENGYFIESIYIRWKALFMEIRLVPSATPKNTHSRQ